MKKSATPKLHLLQRFYIIVIAINIIALGFDLYFHRSYSALIESGAVVLLSLSLWHLHVKHKLTLSAYLFLLITSSTLLGLIAINHFATMSVVFVLLLPLSTLLFLRLRQSLFMVGVLIIILGAMLYLEHLYNPDNPIAHNPQALFNLAYAAAIIYFFGILYHLSIIRTFDELEDANRQKAMLLSEVHHRVKNNLNVIASIVGLQANRQEGTAHDALLSTKTRIESIAMVHQMLYQHDDFENIGVKDYLEALVKLLRSMYASEQNIDITIESKTDFMPLETMIQLGMITNELLTNSIKYAFKQNSGHVIIHVHNDAEGYRFVYSDDGVGVDDTQRLLKGRSLGIKLIHLAVKQLRGEIAISNESGLTYTIRFTHG